MSSTQLSCDTTDTERHLLPHRLSLAPELLHQQPWLFGGAGYQLLLHSGLTLLLGPNASGKTQVLRHLQTSLQQTLVNAGTTRVVRFVAAGRSAPFEPYRSLSLNIYSSMETVAAVGDYSHRPHRLTYESLIGDVMALDERPDLCVKVEARLEVLFGCRLRLQWAQQGLQLVFLTGESEYPANNEASGVLHLVGLLAAMHDDKVGALLVDEPEISLHPQMQAFLLEELRAVAGDPLTDPAKKLVVLATHSPAMLPLRRITDLPNLAFFTDRRTPPRQVAPGAGELLNKKLGALVARLGATQRAALFAPTVLLVEGPSDQTIVTALATRVKRSLAGAGVEVIPVVGKGEMPATARLFRLMGKRVIALADLDALADSNELVKAFSQEKEAATAAADKGHKSVMAMDEPLRTEFARTVEERWSDLKPLASRHRYLAGCKEADPSFEKARRRAALATLLLQEPDTSICLQEERNWLDLRKRFDALLAVLEAGGCFILRQGTIEDYYADPPSPEASGKPAAADEEAALLADTDEADVRRRYVDALRAIESAAPGPPVNEQAFLREHLAALLAATFARLDTGTTAEELRRIAAGARLVGSEIFTVENVSSAAPNRQLALRVGLASPLFAAAKMPTVVIKREENLNDAVERLLPSGGHAGGAGQAG